MIPSDLLWQKGYSQLMRRDWFNLLYPILGNPRMASVFKFLEERANKKVRIMPDQKNIFAPFDIFSPEDTKLIVLGKHPLLYFSMGSNGLAYSYAKGTDPPSTYQLFRKCIEFAEKQELFSGEYYQKYAEIERIEDQLLRLIVEKKELPVGDSYAITEIEKEYWNFSGYLEEERDLIDMGWYEKDTVYFNPMDTLANQGVLLINAAPTLEFASKESVNIHHNAWNWFTSNLISLLSDEMDENIFFAFEEGPKNLIEGRVDENKHLVLTPEKLTPEYLFTQKINNHIIATKGVKKIIDFKIFLENE